jgi:hypothetical protein
MELRTTREATLHLSLSWARPIQFKPPQPISRRSILILSTHLRLGLPSGLLPSRFPTNNLYAFLFFSGYMPRPPHPPWLDYSNYTWRRVQITKLLIMRFSLLSCHFIPPWSKHPPQHLTDATLPGKILNRNRIEMTCLNLRKMIGFGYEELNIQVHTGWKETK